MVRSYIHKEYYFTFLFTAVTDAALLFKVFKRQTEKKILFYFTTNANYRVPKTNVTNIFKLDILSW